jgi:hypothetical protein
MEIWIELQHSFLKHQIDSCLHVSVRVAFEQGMKDITSKCRATRSGVVTACFYSNRGGLFATNYQEDANLQSAEGVAYDLCNAMHVLRNELRN